MAGRSTHFAAPLLLAVVTGLIVYVSLYPFRFVPDGPALADALRSLSWARAGRGDMFNNVLLYVPFGFCVALVIEPRWGRVTGIVVGTLLGVLRDGENEADGPPRAPAPSLDDVHSLVARVVQAGLPATVAVHGRSWCCG